MLDSVSWGLGLITAAVLVIGLLIIRTRRPAAASRRSARKRQQARAKVAPIQPYLAVSCEGDCPALRPILGKRYLVSEAPSLPLAGCKRGRCDCRYAHHEDRREDEGDRRGLMGLRSELYTLNSGEDRRRRSRGRRAGDAVMA